MSEFGEVSTSHVESTEKRVKVLSIKRLSVVGRAVQGHDFHELVYETNTTMRP